MSFSEFTNKSKEDVLETLQTSLAGLSKKEVALRQEKFGLNEIKTKGVSFFEILGRQIKSPFVYLLLTAAIISILIGRFVDSIAVLAFVFINIVIGFIQEFRAERSIHSLKRFLAKKVKVKRDGKESIVEVKNLVQGDVVLLEAGDIVPADIRIVALHNFLVDESVITGESAPINKISGALPKIKLDIFGAENILFSGTTIISGRVEGIVITTGEQTVLGGISKDVSQIRKESIYEKNILYFSKLILKVVVVTIILIFLANIAVKGFSDFWEILLFSVALIVSILPEALPAVVTFALSRGSINLAKEKVVVKRLSAIEDLGNIDLLCVDKTGTLTQNKLSLEKVISADKKKMFLYAILSSGGKDVQDKILNPFDSAILKRAPEEALKQANKYNIISELPFDSFRMKSSFLVESKDGEKFIITKGAPEKILKACTKLSVDYDKSELKEDLEREGQDGRRTLAYAFKKVEAKKEIIKEADEKGLTFVGYFVFEDPLKSSAKEAIEFAKKIGVQIKIITGDSKEVTSFVAKKTGLPFSNSDVVSGPELEAMTKEDFEDACNRCSVFARISPDLKHQIIKTLQRGYEVAFMGEGVNDAPALKSANVGIAVLEASDVAREASDIVLLEKDLRVVVNGIRNGRTIFANINKYIKTTLSNNFGQFYSMAAISLFINFLPMLPVQILLSNLLSDLPLISIATDAVDVSELRKPKMYELRNVLPLIISLALVGTLFDFVFFTIFYKYQPSTIQTLWFVEGLLTDLALIYVLRTRGKFWKAKKPSFWLAFSTITAGIVVVALPFLQIGQNWFHLVALSAGPMAIVFAIVILYFILSEVVKLTYFRHWRFDNNVIR